MTRRQKAPEATIPYGHDVRNLYFSGYRAASAPAAEPVSQRGARKRVSKQAMVRRINRSFPTAPSHA
jgi:hypothetical protein